MLKLKTLEGNNSELPLAGLNFIMCGTKNEKAALALLQSNIYTQKHA